jgi:hypothetical protein
MRRNTACRSGAATLSAANKARFGCSVIAPFRIGRFRPALDFLDLSDARESPAVSSAQAAFGVHKGQLRC